MNTDLLPQVDALARLYLIPIGWKLLGAAVVWIVGGWTIKIARAALGRFFRLRHFDMTLAAYLETSVALLLQVLLFIAILGVLGIETTSFAALLAAAALAIGAAWSGLLANFAAGVFLLVFRPFKVGDAIAAAGVSGVVREIGLFVTSIITADNVLTYVGNNRLFADTIQNFSASPFRRVDLTIQLLPDANPDTITDRLLARVRQIPHVLQSPPPSVEILSFNALGTAVGPVLAVRPCCQNEYYSQVYFDTTKVISEVCSEGPRHPSP